MTKPRILVIVPCHNEEESVGEVLRGILSCPQGYEAIVIDDESQDSTFQIARKWTRTVRLLRNLGIGGAVQTGIKYAYAHNYDFCVQIDGDGQHPPSEIAKLLDSYFKQPRSIVIGSRYLQNDSYRSTVARRFGAKAIAWSLNALFRGCSVTDPTSGMRLMDKEATAFFARNYPHDFPEPISLAWALRKGLSVGEVAVQMRAREYGSSSIGGLKPLAYMLRVLGYIVLARLMRSSFR